MSIFLSGDIFFSPLSTWTNYLNKVTFVCQTFTECHSFLLGPARLVHPVLFPTWWVHPLIHKPTACTSILKGTQVSHPVFWLTVSSTTNTYSTSRFEMCCMLYTNQPAMSHRTHNEQKQQKCSHVFQGLVKNHKQY